MSSIVSFSYLPAGHFLPLAPESAVFQVNPEDLDAEDPDLSGFLRKKVRMPAALDNPGLIEIADRLKVGIITEINGAMTYQLQPTDLTFMLIFYSDPSLTYVC